MPQPDAVTTILIRARERLRSQERWTTGQLGRDRAGHSVPALARGAVRWCAMGALKVECGRIPDAVAFSVPAALYKAGLARLEAAAAPETVVEVNDKRGHAAVLALYDSAIRVK